MAARQHGPSESNLNLTTVYFHLNTISTITTSRIFTRPRILTLEPVIRHPRNIAPNQRGNTSTPESTRRQQLHTDNTANLQTERDEEAYNTDKAAH
ncbi:hypothetical protein Cob_v005469 [Colletotrichum orbiculare MAFF 240422]|uniref:Uncharacterized protein n=1 Tax=Colletotrichum orbiculare (strain 104-T / ATCC 96160 / CBS 514.97 / LARS 414 / MAFF 240422) TaxID=1213857 RepID=A0A484FSP6_COLOR|nr:hypothetical protein Cob_v005469 [Colletotrichum orbiculare MAFF 240422]